MKNVKFRIVEKIKSIKKIYFQVTKLSNGYMIVGNSTISFFLVLIFPYGSFPGQHQGLLRSTLETVYFPGDCLINLSNPYLTYLRFSLEPAKLPSFKYTWLMGHLLKLVLIKLLLNI